MSVTSDILRTYRAPRAVLRGILAAGPREDRAIAYVMLACLIIFVAQWPLMSREAFENPEVPFEARLGATLIAWLFAMPLVLYGLAGLSHVVARLFGGKGSWYSARIALFWTLLAVSPLMLLRGLVAGFIGPGVQMTVCDGIVTLAFLVLWSISLIEAERAP
jgi:Na+(H+)/acetate symporter ActP